MAAEQDKEIFGSSDSIQKSEQDWYVEDFAGDGTDSTENDNSIETTSFRSRINWAGDSPIQRHFDSYDAATSDPFRGARMMAKATLSVNSDLREKEESRQADYRSNVLDSVKYFGRSLHVTGLETYNRTVRGGAGPSSSLSPIASQRSAEFREGFREPSGLVFRPTNQHYQSFFSRNLERGSSFKGSFFQFQEKSVVQTVIQSSTRAVAASGRFELLTHRPLLSVRQANETDEAYTERVNRVIDSPTFGNAVTLAALNESKTGTTKGYGIELAQGSFHPKMGYFAKDGVVEKAVFGTQNITSALPRSNTIEEVLFINRIDFSSRIKSTKKKLQETQDAEKRAQLTKELTRLQQAAVSNPSILEQIRVGTDVLFAVAEKQREGKTDRRGRELGRDNKTIKNEITATYNREFLPRQALNGQAKKLFFNQDLKAEINNTLKRAHNKQADVIISMQYLETVFVKNSANGGMEADKDYKKFKSDLLGNLRALADSGKLTILTSATSVASGQGLFYLLDQMRNRDPSNFGKDERELFNLLERKGAFKLVPTQFMHSKTIAVLGETAEDDEYIISSANMSAMSYLYNVEAGLRLQGSDLEAVGINRQRWIDYYRGGGRDSIRQGLYLEHKGNREMVLKTVEMFKAMGGVEDYSYGKNNGDAPFIFNRRYIQRKRAGSDDYYHEEVGFDIQFKDKYTFSVTVGAQEIAEYTGRPDKNGNFYRKKVMPVVYMNKGNRIIPGAIYMNQSSTPLMLMGSSDPTKQGTLLSPGEATQLDALQVLSGIIYTMQVGSNYEREQRALYHGLMLLQARGAHGLEVAYDRAFGPDRQSSKDNFIRQLNTILDTKDLDRLKKYAEDVKLLINTSPEARDYYARTISKAKSTLMSNIIESFLQPHSLPYNYMQRVYDLSVFGVADENLKLLTDNFVPGIGASEDNRLILPGPILSHIDLDHTVPLMVNSMPTRRSVGATSRPETRDPLSMVGGLYKAALGTVNVSTLGLFNAIPGLRMQTAGEYRQQLDIALAGVRGASSTNLEKFRESMVKRVFALTHLGKREEEKIEDDAVMLFFPYPKTEQVSQRLKNLMSVRTFVMASEKFASYMRSFGTAGSRTLLKGQEGLDLKEAIASDLPSAMPSTQFEILKSLREKHGEDHNSLLRELRERALDVDNPVQGFVGNSKRYLVNMGSSSMSDFSYVNAAEANKTGWVFSHRSQYVLDMKALGVSMQDIQQRIASKLKVGTMFIATDHAIRAEGNSKALYNIIVNKINDALKQGQKGDITREYSTDEINSIVRDLIKNRPDEFKFLDHFKFTHSGQFDLRIKKGVYNIDITDKGLSVEKVGRIEEGDSSFIIESLITSKTLGSNRVRAVWQRVKAPAFARRANQGISVISRPPSTSESDRQPGMASLNLEFLTMQNLSSGLRSSTAKGPMLLFDSGVFVLANKRYGQQLDKVPDRIKLNRDDVFGIISSGQMKGFVFGAGYSLLRDNDVGKLVEPGAKGGRKVAEALALLMLGETGKIVLEDGKEWSGKVKDVLLDAYKAGHIDNRKEMLQLLKLGQYQTEGKFKSRADWSLAAKGLDPSVGTAHKPTLGIYEGLLGLIHSKYLNPESGERGLIDTVVAVLKGEAGAAEALADQAQTLLTNTINLYSQELEKEVGGVKVKVRVFDEQRGRSGALLAFMLKASQDLLGDDDRQTISDRINENVTSEIGYRLQSAVELTGTTIKAELQQGIDKKIAALTKAYGADTAIQQDLDDLRTKLTANLATGSQTGFVTALEDFDRKYQYQLGSRLVEDFDALFDKQGGLWNTVDRITKSDKVRSRYEHEARAMGIELPKGKTDKDKEQLKLALHYMQAIKQTTRFMEIEIDPGINKGTPAVAGQDNTNLEGHYAQTLSGMQLRLYTHSVKDARAYTTIQDTLIRMGGVLEEQHGYLSQSKIRSTYHFYSVNALEFGATPGAGAVGEGELRRESLRFALSYSQGYSAMTEKMPIRVLSRKGELGEFQVSPAYSAFSTYLRRMGGKATNEDLWDSLDYMMALTDTAQRRVDFANPEDEAEKAETFYTIAERQLFMHDSVRQQAKYILSDMVKLTRDVLLGSQPKTDKETVQLVKGDSGALAIKVTQKDTLAERLVSLADIANQLGKTDLEEKIRKGTASREERQTALAIQVAQSITVTDAVLNWETEKDTGAVDSYYAELYELVRTRDGEVTSELSIRGLIKSLAGNDISNRLKATVDKDPGKVYLEGRQHLRDLAEAEIAVSQDKDPQRFKAAQELLTSVGNTYSLAIPQLEFTPQEGDTGRYLVQVAPASRRSFEVGLVLGLDILEKVALIFPDFSSEALDSQFKLSAALYDAEASGTLGLIYDYLDQFKEGFSGEVKPLVLDSEHATYYQNLLQAARLSRESAVDLTTNEKIVRNAMGDQLKMKGASYIAMASLLVDKGEVVFGSRFDDILKLQAGGLGQQLLTLVNTLKEPEYQKEPDSVKHLLEVINTKGEFLRGVGAETFNSLDLLRTRMMERVSLADKTGPDGRVLTFNEVKDSPLVRSLFSILTGEEYSTENLKLAERDLFASGVTADRQGAPSMTGHDFASGNVRETVGELNSRYAVSGSEMSLDKEGSHTLMLLASSGSQFTQLGDYDGDSFQAAITRMAETSAAMQQSFQAYLIAVKEYSLLQGRRTALGEEELEGAEHTLTLRRMERDKALQTYEDHLKALKELHDQSKILGRYRIRSYAEQFIGLPEFMLEGTGMTGAIKDDEIPILVKQTRDTISGYYDHRDKLGGDVLSAFSKLTSLSVGADGTVSYEGEDLSKWDKQLVETFTKADRELWEGFQQNKTEETPEKRLKADKERILTTAASLIQRGIGIENVQSMSKKAVGSLLDLTAFREVQAIVGDTGTGLLGKTYNTVIPLAAMSAAQVNTMRALHQDGGQRVDELLKTVIGANEVGATKKDKDFYALLKQKVDSSDPDTQVVHAELTFPAMKRQLNASYGLLLNVQQFLRDAALKPKEKGSVGLAASQFRLDGSSYDFVTDSQGKPIVGLANLLEAAKTDDQRSVIMRTFIGKEVGYQLAYDFGFTTGDKQVDDTNRINTQELRAFSALQLLNEYVGSGGLSGAADMMEKSGYSDLLKAQKELMIKQAVEERDAEVKRLGEELESHKVELLELRKRQGPLSSDELQQLHDLEKKEAQLEILKGKQVAVTDTQVVEATIASALGKFQATFIYDNVLEGDKHNNLLQPMAEKTLMEMGLDKTGAKIDSSTAIEKRVAEYESLITQKVHARINGAQYLPPEEIQRQAEKARQEKVEETRRSLSEAGKSLTDDSVIAEIQSAGRTAFDDKMLELRKSMSSDTALNVAQQAVVNQEVERFRNEQYEYQKHLGDAISREYAEYQEKTEGVEAPPDFALGSAVFKATVEYQKQVVEAREMLKILPELARVNQFIKAFRDNKFGGTQQDLDELSRMELVFHNMLARNKLDIEAVAEVTSMASRFIEKVSGEGAEDAKMALLSIGGLNLPSLKEAVETSARKEAFKLYVDSEAQRRTDIAIKEREKELQQGPIRQRRKLTEEERTNIAADTKELVKTELGNEKLENLTEAQKLRMEASDTWKQLYKEQTKYFQNLGVKLMTQSAEDTVATMQPTGVPDPTASATLRGRPTTTTTAPPAPTTSVAKEIAEQTTRGAFETAHAAQMATLNARKAEALENNDTDTLKLIAGVEENLRLTADAGGDRFNSEMQKFYFQQEAALSEQLAAADRRYQRQVRTAGLVEADKAAKRQHGTGAAMSLLAIPVLFSMVQGDITFNDRVAGLFTDIAQSAVTAVSYKDSSLRKVLFSSEGKFSVDDVTAAERASGSAARYLQLGRVRETMRRNYSDAQGLAQGIAFEAIYGTASAAASELSERMFRGRKGVAAFGEILGGLAVMAATNVITERPIPGTYSSYDYAWDMTMKMIRQIKDSIYAASQYAVNQVISGNDYAYDEITGESLEMTVAEGAFELPPEGLAMGQFDYARLLAEDDMLSAGDDGTPVETA